MDMSEVEVVEKAIITGLRCYADFCKTRSTAEDTEKNRHDFVFFSLGTLFQWMQNEMISRDPNVSDLVLRWPSEAN